MTAATTRIPAEVFHPGEYLREELNERGWTISALAKQTGYSVPFVSDVVREHKTYSPQFALALARALGTSASYWVNLVAQYRVAQMLRRAEHEGAQADAHLGQRFTVTYEPEPETEA